MIILVSIGLLLYIIWVGGARDMYYEDPQKYRKVAKWVTTFKDVLGFLFGWVVVFGVFVMILQFFWAITRLLFGF